MRGSGREVWPGLESSEARGSVLPSERPLPATAYSPGLPKTPAPATLPSDSVSGFVSEGKGQAAVALPPTTFARASSELPHEWGGRFGRVRGLIPGALVSLSCPCRPLRLPGGHSDEASHWPV